MAHYARLGDSRNTTCPWVLTPTTRISLSWVRNATLITLTGCSLIMEIEIIYQPDK